MTGKNRDKGTVTGLSQSRKITDRERPPGRAMLMDIDVHDSPVADSFPKEFLALAGHAGDCELWCAYVEYGNRASQHSRHLQTARVSSI